MKKVIISFVLVINMLLLTSCNTLFTNKGKAARAEEKSRAKITTVENKQNINTKDKIDAIAGLAFGTDYALGKVDSPPEKLLLREI
jgi:hypothetical protein